LACESQCKDTTKAVRHIIHTVDCNQSNSDDELQEVYVVELVWLKQAKSLACFSLQPVQKKQQEEDKFTFKLASVTKYSMNYSKTPTLK
jgi:hypothetical protein